MGILEKLALSLAALVRLLPEWFGALDVPRALELATTHGTRLKHGPSSHVYDVHRTSGRLRVQVAERETRLYLGSVDRLREKARTLGLDATARDVAGGPTSPRGTRVRRLEALETLETLGTAGHGRDRSPHLLEEVER